MRIKKIYIPEIEVKNGKIYLSSEYFSNYIKNVLRFKINENLQITNNGMIYYVIIESYEKKGIVFRIENQETEKKQKNKIILIQSVFDWQRLEWLVEKSVETGIDEIVFIRTQRSKIKIKNWQNKKERLNKIIYKALTQSHRTYPLKIYEPIDLKNLKNLDGIKIIFDIKDENLTFDTSIINNNSDVYLAIGPEGGFTEDEILFFQNMGFKRFKMPFGVLRAETAGIVFSSLIFYFKSVFNK